MFRIEWEAEPEKQHRIYQRPNQGSQRSPFHSQAPEQPYRQLQAWQDVRSEAP